MKQALESLAGCWGRGSHWLLTLGPGATGSCFVIGEVASESQKMTNGSYEDCLPHSKALRQALSLKVGGDQRGSAGQDGVTSLGTDLLRGLTLFLTLKL